MLGGTGTLPSPLGINSGGNLIIKNTDGFPQILSTPSGTFTGQFGSALATLNLFNNNNNTLFSDGTNWTVNDPFSNFYLFWKPAYTIINYNVFVRGTPLRNTGLTLSSGTFTINSGTIMNFIVIANAYITTSFATGIVGCVISHSLLETINTFM